MVVERTKRSIPIFQSTHGGSRFCEKKIQPPETRDKRVRLASILLYHPTSLDLYRLNGTFFPLFSNAALEVTSLAAFPKSISLPPGR